MKIDRDELLRVFSVESSEQLDSLEETLLKLERSPKDPEYLDVIFRAAHSLKGNASVVHLTAIEALTHALEDVLERVKDGLIPVTVDLTTLLLRVVDGFRRIIPLALDGVDDPQPEYAELLAWLEANKYRVVRQTDLAIRPVPPTPNREPELLATNHSEQRTLRVDVEKLDSMLNLLGEIAVARGRLTSLLSRDSRASRDEIRDAHSDTDRLYLDLQEQLMRARMVPLRQTFRRYLRVVRDLALERGKEIELVLEGDEVEVDTAVVEGIKDPLTHMIRNAIDHGIEPPKVRTAKGKPAHGTILLRAQHEGSSILLTVSDDGAGLDRERILRRGRALKLVAADEQPSDQRLFKLIFAAGFSTAERVTELSGRGIGMNVVETNVDALRGSVSVASEAGRGTTITLKLPLTLAIIEGFSVGVGEETYVLPLDAVVECVDLPASERNNDQPQGVIELRGQPLAYVRLGRLLDIPANAAARQSLVVLEHDGHRAGIAVDTLVGAGQTVIKPLSTLVDHAPTVAGCAVLGSGRVALILDVPALFRAAVDQASTPGDQQ